LSGRRGWRFARLIAGIGAAALVAAGCAGAGGGGGGGAGSGDSGGAINVLMVGNPQMEDIQKLTEANFTAQTGIKVNFTILPENELRDKVTQDIATGAGQYDVVTVGAYEVPIWAKNGWLHEVSTYTQADANFDAADLLPPMVQSLSGDDGKLYAVPFYGESSFLMYRKDVFEAKGLTMPEKPTWDQVAQLAAQVDGAQPGMRGICLRGLPGWGEQLAPLDTVINTFGGRWYDTDWNAQLTSPATTKAVTFYLDLIRDAGEAGAPNAGFSECLTAYSQGQAAMWYDATVAAGSLEDRKVSKVVGKNGYAPAPVMETEWSGWLWAWSLAVPNTAKDPDAAWEFVSWATSKEYIRMVGERLGWERVPPGSRQSTYEIDEYVRASAGAAEVTLDALKTIDPNRATKDPVPYTGIQYVQIPEFQDLGTSVSQQFAAVLAGNQSVEEALETAQSEAEAVAEDGYKD
jgi:sorbitol/mannitol transport system substrate-binding protein